MHVYNRFYIRQPNRFLLGIFYSIVPWDLKMTFEEASSTWETAFLVVKFIGAWLITCGLCCILVLHGFTSMQPELIKVSDRRRTLTTTINSSVKVLFYFQ